MPTMLERKIQMTSFILRLLTSPSSIQHTHLHGPLTSRALASSGARNQKGLLRFENFNHPNDIEASGPQSPPGIATTYDCRPPIEIIEAARLRSRSWRPCHLTIDSHTVPSDQHIDLYLNVNNSNIYCSLEALVHTLAMHEGFQSKRVESAGTSLMRDGFKARPRKQ
ncbi:uncharacterized protein MYCFIDRAFT_177890 [Pseudocercospora fijiensis CIRAD86]|uniref:Uncharacterized protein n=1 Tax=Pseudocercospora fijiensis (strain CIRAD86) TaxID=383855 RepID=M3A3T3_PSEFD|nr:uncharacterized protein MYCFIDRAFT_177890 [Pseudocercospora fijiensis CIRAD86]EME79261.1 hypothetical protein MYCFIDRAFT_177890 [Pseudocercospora fijiensis CIRAD86]